MKMKDWIAKLDEYLKLLGKGVLKNAGKVRADEAEKKLIRNIRFTKMIRSANIFQILISK